MGECERQTLRFQQLARSSRHINDKQASPEEAIIFFVLYFCLEAKVSIFALSQNK